MKDCLITFRSVTPAQRGETILRRSHIDCTLQRTPRWMEEQGCGYSLKVECGQIVRAAELLRQGNIPWRKAYLRTPDGTMEEMSL